MENPVFDASRPIAINLRTPGGLKTVRVRFPSDDEWITRQRRRKVLVKQLGRGISETTVANGEDVDAALVALIQEKPGNSDAPEIDPFEAMKVVGNIKVPGGPDCMDITPDGKELWVTKLEMSAHAVPITYEGKNGKQYVAITAAGASALDDPMPTGSEAVAVFALP